MTMLATTSATRLDEKRNTPSGLQSIAASSYQYQRWCLLSVVLAVFAWTQAMSYFAHLNDSIVTSSEFKNATTVASADADSHEVKMKQQGSIDSVLDKVKRIDQKSDGSAARVPQVIWLMSFPNSGTTYTNKLVQGISNTTTATNYGTEVTGYKTSIPISPNLLDGPFFRFPEEKYSKYILTKTHCGGFCIRCSPDRYILDAKQFERECRSGNKKVDGKEISIKSAYNASIPKKAVHIIRNPFDNLVARLHHQRKSWIDSEDSKSEMLAMFNSSEEGFRKWCRFVDYSAASKMKNMSLLSNMTKQLFAKAPCAADIHRWTQFHNLAMQVTDDRMKIPVHFIFYENYTEAFDETVSQLLDFLQLSAVSEAPTFIRGKEYPEYFSDNDRVAVAKLVKHLATEQSWPLLRHYFDGLLE